MRNINERISNLKQEIDKLPKGSIAKKTIKGSEYFYFRYYINGVRKEKYIDISLVDELKGKIDKRKQMEEELKELKNKVTLNNKIKRNNTFSCNIRINEDLRKFVKSVENYKKRKCYKQINDYIYSNSEKVFILYGLRRTGKTTLIKQIIAEMDDFTFKKSAFIQVSNKDSLASLNKDLKKLEDLGYKYVFIDEVTMLEEFIEGAALFSDVYVASGMKIVLSGTDSLGFILASSEQLYDRCILLHTTFIPYKEFEEVLNIKGIDEYIRYGGTMSLSGINYNDDFVFDNKNTTSQYIDSSIASNIQHSLKYYNYGNHFRNLITLYENNELTNVINRVVEDINHRFTKEVLTKKFLSNDLAISAKNLRSDKQFNNTILDDIDIELFTKRLKELLEILDKDERKVDLNDEHVVEIKEYLSLLDLIYEIDVKSIPTINKVYKNVIISQPGLRYAQAISLIDSLIKDEKFNELSIIEKDKVAKRIQNEIKGRMMEDIILLESKLANNKKEVFKLKFAVGEFDMVIFDNHSLTCKIYEVKYNDQVNEEQYKHLIDDNKCKLTTHFFGEIIEKSVIYRGESKIYNSIRYINVEEYLKSLY